MFEFLGNLPLILQIILFFSALGVTGVAVFVVARGGHLKIGRFELNNDQTPNTAGCSDEQDVMIRSLENRLTIFHRDSCQIVRRYMHQELGVPQQYLENNGDFILASNLLWRGIYGKNGKHSVRTIIEDRIIHEDYLLRKEKDPDKFISKRRALMKEITRQIESEMQELFNNEYHNIYSVTTEENPSEPITMHRALFREKLATLISEFINGDLSSSVEALFYGE